MLEEVEAAFKKYDTNLDGRLSTDEALEYVKMWAAKRTDNIFADEFDTFDDIDKNGDGFIDR